MTSQPTCLDPLTASRSLQVGETIVRQDANGVPRRQATQVYEVVRRDILSGRHAPGSKLKIQDLATDLDVSPSAVREALSRLIPERLVTSRDQRGFAVAPLSVTDLEDLTDLRCEIEAIALRRSVELGDVDWEVGILTTGHRLRSISFAAAGERESASTDWIAAHAAFHEALVAGCGSPRLRAFHASLYQQSERYRASASHYDAARGLADEHRVIEDLAVTRNADGLIDAALEHIRSTMRLIIDASRHRNS